MPAISNTPRPGYAYDSTDDVWYPIGTGPHTHADYITSGSAINPNVVDAKGDIIAATAADTVARLAVGANDTVLTADSSEATGLKWAAPAVAGANWSLLNSGGTSLSGTSTSITGISGQDKLLIVVKGASHTGSIDDTLGIRFNTTTTSVYDQQGSNFLRLSSYGGGVSNGVNSNTTSIQLFNTSSNAASVGSGFCLITGCNAAGVKAFTAGGGANAGGGNEQKANTIGGIFNSSSTISSVQITWVGYSQTFDAGTVFIYGSA